MQGGASHVRTTCQVEQRAKTDQQSLLCSQMLPMDVSSEVVVREDDRSCRGEKRGVCVEVSFPLAFRLVSARRGPGSVASCNSECKELDNKQADRRLLRAVLRIKFNRMCVECMELIVVACC